MQLTFIDLFSGIGGFHTGLENVGFRCIGWCEKDRFAQISYRALYDTENLWFSDDISTVKGEDMPMADVWTFGFPCQDVSVAGRHAGLEGSRSSLFFEVMRLLHERRQNEKALPEWLIVENVRGLLSTGGGMELPQNTW